MENRIISEIDPYGEENWNDEPEKQEIKYINGIGYLSVDWINKNILYYIDIENNKKLCKTE